MKYEGILKMYENELYKIEESLCDENPVDEIFLDGLLTKFLYLTETCVHDCSDKCILEAASDFESFARITKNYAKLYEG